MPKIATSSDWFTKIPICADITANQNRLCYFFFPRSVTRENIGSSMKKQGYSNKLLVKWIFFSIEILCFYIVGLPTEQFWMNREELFKVKAKGNSAQALPPIKP